MSKTKAAPAPPVLERLPTLSGDIELVRRYSSIQLAVNEHEDTVEAELTSLTIAEPEELGTYQQELAGCVFVGHLATDMDSIGSAVGAAELFGGVAARASDINSETEFALEYFNIPSPAPFDDVAGTRGVCLVDHCQTSQMHPSIKASSIRGIIDHHALQSSTVCTDLPIYVDIRPWGSACTIIAHTFVAMRRRISPKTAALLLCGILSDTLNLRSPTTTSHDRRMVALLCRCCEISEPDELAKSLFKAKSKTLSLLSAHQLLRGDQKTFEFTRPDGHKTAIGFGVVETTDIEAMLARKGELLLECRALKAEEHLDIAFLALVDIANLRSLLLVCGNAEASLAEAAFGGKVGADQILDLGSRVSRKKNFVPPLSSTIQGGWVPPPPPPAVSIDTAPAEDFGKVVMMCTPTGCMTQRVLSSFGALGTVASVAAAAHHHDGGAACAGAHGGRAFS